MKILYSRLLESIKSKPKIENLCDDLTMIGIEVDGIESLQGDKVIDFDLTPNRGDCFSVKGLARDYCAYKEKIFFSKKSSLKEKKNLQKKLIICKRCMFSLFSGFYFKFKIKRSFRII